MVMIIEAPAMGESVTEATVAKWHKKVGDFVEADTMVAELETDKVNLEVMAPAAGVLMKTLVETGATVQVGQPMAELDETAHGAERAAAPAVTEPEIIDAPAPEEKAPKSRRKRVSQMSRAELRAAHRAEQAKAVGLPTPAAADMIAENHLDLAAVAGAHKDKRIGKDDVIDYMAKQTLEHGINAAPGVNLAAAAPSPVSEAIAPEALQEERVPMPPMRKAIANHLKNAQNTAAMLTTWNEVDVSEVMALRKAYQEKFVAKHGIKLGFMSFFTKAVVEALKAFPALNAQIDGDDIIYKHHYDIGIAVSTDRGLMVPVLKDADKKSLAQMERDIADFGARARDGKLAPAELKGGTFSITNGGVFGSLLNMPIINYPQVGILGMNDIKQRPVAVNGEVVIRPMMYLSLTYDHRIVDGKESVTFLKTVKEILEDPRRLLLDL